MARRPSLSEDDSWVELPTGIFTAEGFWFHTSEEALRDFADPVIDEVGIRPLLRQAGVWMKSADSAALICLAILLLTISPLPALLVTVLLFVFWEAFSSRLVFVPVVKSFSLFSSAAFQAILYVLAMSWLASEDEFLAAGIGLAGFILIRWGIVRKLSQPLTRRLEGTATVPKTDRILRSLIVRYAIARRVTLSSTESFEKRIIEIWQRRNRK